MGNPKLKSKILVCSLGWISCRTPIGKPKVTLGPVGPQVGFGVCPGDELDAEYLVGG